MRTTRSPAGARTDNLERATEATAAHSHVQQWTNASTRACPTPTVLPFPTEVDPNPTKWHCRGGVTYGKRPQDKRDKKDEARRECYEASRGGEGLGRECAVKRVEM